MASSPVHFHPNPAITLLATTITRLPSSSFDTIRAQLLEIQSLLALDDTESALALQQEREALFTTTARGRRGALTDWGWRDGWELKAPRERERREEPAREVVESNEGRWGWQDGWSWAGSGSTVHGGDEDVGGVDEASVFEWNEASEGVAAEVRVFPSPLPLGGWCADVLYSGQLDTSYGGSSRGTSGYTPSSPARRSTTSSGRSRSSPASIHDGETISFVRWDQEALFDSPPCDVRPLPSAPLDARRLKLIPPQTTNDDALYTMSVIQEEGPSLPLFLVMSHLELNPPFVPPRTDTPTNESATSFARLSRPASRTTAADPTVRFSFAESQVWNHAPELQPKPPGSRRGGGGSHRSVLSAEYTNKPLPSPSPELSTSRKPLSAYAAAAAGTPMERVEIEGHHDAERAGCGHRPKLSKVRLTSTGFLGFFAARH